MIRVWFGPILPRWYVYKIFPTNYQRDSTPLCTLCRQSAEIFLSRKLKAQLALSAGNAAL